MHLSKQLSIFFVLVLFLGTACSDLFNTSDNGPKLEFSVHVPAQLPVVFNGDTLSFDVPDDPILPDENPPFISRVEGNQILIEGYFYMDCPSNNSMSGKIDNSGDAVNIKVKAGIPKGPCPSIPNGSRLYTATINELEPGSYRVKIVHVNDFFRSNESGKSKVFDEQFVIE